jgi:nucleoside diphosphate kinase
MLTDVKALPEATSPKKNSAFVFVKPHAVTEATTDMVRKGLKAKGLRVTSEGILTSDVIDEKKLIDQHYYAIASKATILKPHELNVPKDKFKSFFGLEWEDALKQNIVFNALDACKEFGCSADELSKAWNQAKKDGKLVKFGGGFYCGRVNMNGKELLVFNAFFMTMRSAFTAPGKEIHYYTVEWDEDKLSWEDFRGKVLGPTDPKDAPAGSLRGEILAKWKELGLASEPNVGDNGVHASASPFEATAERMNWLEKRCDQDDYCKELVKAGVKEATINAWSVDPQVKGLDGKKGSIFDMLEDLDATNCAKKAVALQKAQ